MQFVIGIDSGGTHFRIRIATLHSELLAEYDGPPLGYFTQNMKAFEESFRKYLLICLSKFGGSIDDCICVVCGISGIDTEEYRTQFNQLLKKIIGNNSHIVCLNDAELAFKAIVGDYGILLNSGTGSIAFGKGRNGKVDRVGGWPLGVFGDEGSGAWISLHAIRLIGKWFDGIVSEGLLIKLLQKNLKINTRKDYMDFCLNHDINDLAIISPLVDQAAISDPQAVQIINDAAMESFYLVSHLANKLGFQKSDVFKVGFWGSNILKGNLHRQIFCKKLLSLYPHVEFCFPERDLTMAAIDFAIDESLNLGIIENYYRSTT